MALDEWDILYGSIYEYTTHFTDVEETRHQIVYPFSRIVTISKYHISDRNNES